MARPFDLKADPALLTLLLTTRFAVRPLARFVGQFLMEIFNNTQTIHSRPQFRITFEASHTMAAAGMKPRYIEKNRRPFRHVGRRRRCR